MKNFGKWIQAGAALGLALSMMTNTAAAQSGEPAKKSEQRDCSKAPADMKAQCEARNKAEAKCGKLEGDARRICQRDELPRDCAKSENKARCEAEVAAHKACRGDVKTYRACMESKRPDAKK
jgi:hypothetical protein